MYRFAKLINDKFILDGSTGSVFYAEDHLIEALRQTLNLNWKSKKVDDEKLKYTKKLIHRKINEGYFKEMPFKGCQIPTLKDIDSSKLLLMTLLVTEECNLRCKYCPYSYTEDSNIYRYHKSVNMTQSVANQAINLFKQICIDGSTIGFYGGEPLLNFDLIKYVVNRIKNEISNKKINFALTTNLNYLSEDIAQFLAENKFIITVSIDGPKHINDKYRQKIDGSGSFEKVIENLNYIKNNYFEYFSENITSNSVLVSHKDLDVIDSFFSENINNFRNSRFEIASNSNPVFYKSIGLNPQIEAHAINEWIFKNLDSASYYIKFDKSVLLKSLLDKIIKVIEHDNSISKDDLIPFKSCIPGHKILVKTDGNLSICEKGENIEIGHVSTGIDLKKSDYLIKEWTNIVNSECINCWAVKFCKPCYIVAWDDKNFNIKKLREYCKNFRINVLKWLEIYLTKKKQDSGFFKKQYVE